MKKPKAVKEAKRRLNARNWGVFVLLLIFVALIYGITIVRMKAGG